MVGGGEDHQGGGAMGVVARTRHPGCVEGPVVIRGDLALGGRSSGRGAVVRRDGRLGVTRGAFEHLDGRPDKLGPNRGGFVVCHNPRGYRRRLVAPSMGEWEEAGELVARRGWVPVSY